MSGLDEKRDVGGPSGDTGGAETGDGPDADATSIATVRRSSELLWHDLDRSGRGPKPSLTLAQVIEAAVTVADADGIDALSMRRIARELGVGTMSLYRYVPGKDVLLDLMLDHVTAPSDSWHAPELDAARPQWRAALELSARESRAMYLRHPWLLQVNWSRPVFGPNTLASFEVVVRRLRDLPVSDRERVNLVSVLDSYVTGAVRMELLYVGAAEETGVSEEEYWQTQTPVLERAMASGDYPALAGMDEDSFSGDWEEGFELGLSVLLDGIERREWGAAGDPPEGTRPHRTGRTP